MTQNKLFHSLMLILAAIIWGIAFVFQSMANKYLGPYSINCFRSLIASIVLIPLTCFSLRKDKKENVKYDCKYPIIGGIVAGIFLVLASVFQQIGLNTASTGKSAFITTFYIVLVPIIALILFKQKCQINCYISIGLALIGLGLLCVTDFSFAISKGDLYLFICALFFACQITCIDRVSSKSNLFLLALIQMLTSFVVSLVLMLIFEKVNLDQIKNSIVPILYLGIGSSGIAYTIQVISQKHINSTLASLLMSLESVFSCISGVIIYTFYIFSDVPQYLSTQQILGCVVMFIAVILSELPSSWFSFKKKD